MQFVLRLTKVQHHILQHSLLCVIPEIAPYIEDFDNGISNCWIQELAADDFDWTLNTGPTPSKMDLQQALQMMFLEEEITYIQKHLTLEILEILL